MKKSILFVLFAIFSIAGFSQVTWNAKVGMNISNWTDAEGTDPKIGFKIGGGLEYAFDKTWALQPSLFISTKGTKDSGDGMDLTVNQVYLELPIMAAARIPVADNANLVFSAGPYFACGIAGKTTVKESGVEVSIDTFGDDATDLQVKRFDAGFGFGVAAEFGNILVGLEGQYGFVKLIDIIDTNSPKNMNFSISLGYKF